MSWLTLAENTPQGSHQKVKCINACGQDRSMIINHSHEWYSAYCFRCGKIGAKSKGYQTLHQLEKIRELDRAARLHSKVLELPQDTNYDVESWPSEARFWLHSASIYGGRLCERRIGYSVHLQRVVLPVYDASGCLTFYQLRRIYGTGPKYISPSINRESILYWCTPEQFSLDEVIVVEDILSAIRVGKHIPCVSLLGTKISTQQAAALSHFKQVTTWLDPDIAGIEGAVAVRRAMNLVTETRNIKSTLDPKMLSDRKILEVLRE